jgi:guanosine-3',5'-bis(diphosphate) 3'-pyrophosphohydrolase
MTMNSTEYQRLLGALSFAAHKHRFQRRKDADATPYINHPIEVARILIEVGGQTDIDLLVAAVLHDCIEDTETTPEEIASLFGTEVLSIVLEVTDDKRLPKEERKRLQVAHAARKSERARKLKLADKICNVYDIQHHPPAQWSEARKTQYLEWVSAVLQQLEGTNLPMEKHLHTLLQRGLTPEMV